MFLTIWLTFMLVGLSLAIIIFIWSVKSGQFDNPKRASALAIPDADIKLTKPDKFVWRKEIIALLFFCFLGLILLVITITIAINN